MNIALAVRFELTMEISLGRLTVYCFRPLSKTRIYGGGGGNRTHLRWFAIIYLTYRTLRHFSILSSCPLTTGHKKTRFFLGIGFFNIVIVLLHQLSSSIPYTPIPVALCLIMQLVFTHVLCVCSIVCMLFKAYIVSIILFWCPTRGVW